VTKYATIRPVRHTADEMFALVADVEAYPEFVPLCSAMSVESRTKDGATEIVVARMTVAYSLFHESFASSVRLDPGALKVTVAAIDGPFIRLDNSWWFEPDAAGGCLVHFDIDYEFRSRTLGLLFGAVFDHAFRRFAAAFEERADELYGPKAAPRA
jgi:coenzyme Q-binding protein COQ10